MIESVPAIMRYNEVFIGKNCTERALAMGARTVNNITALDPSAGLDSVHCMVGTLWLVVHK